MNGFTLSLGPAPRGHQIRERDDAALATRRCLVSQRAAVLVIVTGHPATGKTTFAHTLAKATGLPLFTKDDIKERLDESLPARDRNESRQLGIASYSLLRHIVEVMLAAGEGLIVESNFDPAFLDEWLSRLEKQYDVLSVQVALHASPEIILERYRQRAESGVRHDVHFDGVAIDEVRESVKSPLRPLQVNGRTFKFDTSDFALFNSDSAVAQVAVAIKESATRSANQ